jgi:sulfate adenylyltransferase subunit 1 (EFTu-like GTPase family)
MLSHATYSSKHGYYVRFLLSAPNKIATIITSEKTKSIASKDVAVNWSITPGSDTNRADVITKITEDSKSKYSAPARSVTPSASLILSSNTFLVKTNTTKATQNIEIRETAKGQLNER